jgi:glucose/arabinose dehydrogenase
MRGVNRSLLMIALVGAGCGSSSSVPPVMDKAVPFDGTFCTLPGSVVTQGGQRWRVTGAAAQPALDWLTVPDGFCAHHFATVPNARQLRFAPGGELFVASPTKLTTGGGPNGMASIVVLADDDRDGLAESNGVFLSNLPATQGLLFTGGYLYYQDDTKIRRMTYASGQRTATAAGDVIADINVYSSSLHWPKVLDVADDGTIYVTNGGDQAEMCDPSRPFHGGILKLDGSMSGAQVEKGFRNPIALRCLAGHGSCWIAELSLDYSGNEGGREKIVPVRQGDDLGYPCCATQNLPFPSVMPVPDCSGIASEANAFIIGETPFGLEFDSQRLWPAPYTGGLFVALHGEFPSWQGTRVVAIATDPVTGAPMPSSDVNGNPTGAQSDFATGWDDGKQDHGRPAAVTGAADGRLFVSNDSNGQILWIAPVGLKDLNPPQ